MLSIAKDYKPYTPKHSICIRNTTNTEPHTEKKATIELGISSSYFSQLKKWNPALYRFMRFHGKGDMKKGYEAWSEYRERITNEFEATYINKYGYFSFMAKLTGLCNSTIRLMYIDAKKGAFNNYKRIKSAKIVIKMYKDLYEDQ